MQRAGDRRAGNKIVPILYTEVRLGNVCTLNGREHVVLLDRTWG
jgi:hypothetical protein